MNTRKLTVAQALIKFLKNQYVSVDGKENPFFAGCFGIFGHGNVAGIGQALNENLDFRYYQARNEQAMVHTAIAFAKVKNRQQIYACTSSIGPGAMNMITGAQTATINRIPVLLLPGDIFGSRQSDPVLQQVEYEYTQDLAANDCFRLVSRYYDRINRPEQLIASLPAAMRVLTSPSETGAVTLSMPQDVQTEAYDFPEELFAKRVWPFMRNRPDSAALLKAADMVRQSIKPVIICGGGVIYSEAEQQLNELAAQTGIPVGETYAGKGAIPYNKPYSLGGLGATGTKIAIEVAGEADLVIGIGTRYSDFISSSNSLFQNPEVKFININVKEFDAFKKGALPLVGDAKVTLEELHQLLSDYQVNIEYREKIAKLNKDWNQEVNRIYAESNSTNPPVHQAAVLGAVNEFMEPTDVMVCASGSMPGDLHKLWRSSNSKNFHLEYGNSCMGYEIAGGLGAKMGAPEREVYVLVGDGGYLMLNSEIVTSIQEGFKLNIIILDNSGYASIGSLAESIGNKRFGTQFRFRKNGGLTGEVLPVDLGKNAESLGAHLFRTDTVEELLHALKEAKKIEKTTVFYIKTDISRTVKGYHAWWEVPVAEVSCIEEVKKARKEYEENKKRQKYFI